MHNLLIISYLLLLSSSLNASDATSISLGRGEREDALPRSLVPILAASNNRGSLARKGVSIDIGPTQVTATSSSSTPARISNNQSTNTRRTSLHTFERLAIPVSETVTSEVGAAANPQENIEKKFLRKEGTNDLIDDYVIAVKDVRMLESEVSNIRGNEILQLEKSAKTMSSRGQKLKTAGMVLTGVGLGLTIVGAAGVITVVSQAGQWMLLSIAVVQAGAKITEYVGGNEEATAVETRKRVDEGIALKRKTATKKGSELQRRGIDVDTIDVELDEVDLEAQLIKVKEPQSTEEKDHN